MSEIKFTIDGRECKGRPGQTIVEAAQENGVYIPVALQLRGPQARRKLPHLHGPGRRPLHGRLHPARRRGHGRRERGPRPRGHAAGHHRDALRRGQPHVPDLREERELRAPGPGLPLRHGGPALPLPVARPGDRRRGSPKILMDHNRCIQCQRCVRAIRTKDGKHVFAAPPALRHARRSAWTGRSAPSSRRRRPGRPWTSARRAPS